MDKLYCKLCNFQGRSIHQHIKASHNISTSEYRKLFGENVIVQIGFSPKKPPADAKHSLRVKKNYKQINDRLNNIHPYNRLVLLDILLIDDNWKKYLGKAKYRTMIRDNPKLYKSIMFYTKHLNTTLENRMYYIIECNYDSNKLFCACGRKYVFKGKWCNRCPEPKKTCISHSIETKRKIRKSTLNYLQSIHGQLFPRYNKNSISIIENYGKQHGYNFQHAENGGEYYIKELGYWVDGYDKEKNVVLEIDESHHYNDTTLKHKDVLRQQEIENFLNCKFVRIKFDK